MDFKNYNKIIIPTDIYQYVLVYSKIDLNKINNSIIFMENDTYDDYVSNANKYILMHNVLCDTLACITESLFIPKKEEFRRILLEKGEELKKKFYIAVTLIKLQIS